MKQIPLLQGKALLIELPEGAKMQGLQTTSPNAIVYADTHGHGVILDLPPGNWRIIEMLSEVREGQAALVVPIHHQSIIGDVYKNFKTDKWDAFDALQSLESAILAEEYYLDKNPLGDKHPELKNGQSGYDHYDDAICWAHAQSRVLDRSRCLLLGREGV